MNCTLKKVALTVAFASGLILSTPARASGFDLGLWAIIVYPVMFVMDVADAIGNAFSGDGCGDNCYSTCETDCEDAAAPAPAASAPPRPESGGG